MTEPVLLRGGEVVHHDGLRREDVLVIDGRIAAVAPALEAPTGTRTLDATGCWVGPGFVDIHTHLREPGREEAETIESAARAAAVGGYSAVVAMPNTEPALDNAVTVAYVLERATRAVVEVAVAGAITMGRRGEHLAEMAAMAELGVRLFTDDGTGVQDPALMRRAMSYAAALGVRLAQHCEDEALAAGGVMNEGELSARLGLAGRCALAEELMVWRDLQLVRLTGCAVHFLHLSTQAAAALVLDARREGLPVSFEVAPHHFTLDESSCSGFDPTYKVHPPLRRQADVAALAALVRDGLVDAVATDHAPHAPETKDLPFDEAPPGMLGLEHAASLTLAVLDTDAPRRLFQVLSRGPAAIARLRAADAPVRHSGHGGDVAVGEDANLVAFDPSRTYTVDRAALQSRSLNTPYHGRTLVGRARHLLVRGAVVLEGEALS
jgi:dihydroorotase